MHLTFDILFTATNVFLNWVLIATHKWRSVMMLTNVNSKFQTNKRVVKK
jgi:hypothetical protein